MEVSMNTMATDLFVTDISHVCKNGYILWLYINSYCKKKILKQLNLV